jgi:hypothetical protein
MYKGRKVGKLTAEMDGGVRRGYTISPTLFNFYLDELMKNGIGLID